MSNDGGPFAAGNGNRTGSTGANGNCSGGGCHASNNANTSATVTLMDGSTPVTSYQAGKTYTVRITGGNLAANLPKFGFQITCVKAASTSTQAGTLATGGTPGIALRSSATPNIIEHTAPIAGTGSGTNWAYTTTFQWTAPTTATAADSVRFYLTLNAVNGTGSESGDQANNTHVTFPYATSSVGTVANSADIVIYPNPASNYINLHIGNTTGTYTVNAVDMRGKLMFSKEVTISNNSQDMTINSDKWSSGLYHVMVSKDGQSKAFPVVIR